MTVPAWQAVSTSVWPWEDTSRRVRVVMVYGESRGANHSEGTAICYPPMVASLEPDRVFMLNSSRAPGLPYEADFLGPEATSLIPAKDCRFGNRAEGFSGNPNDPIGQSLSSFAYHLDAADEAAGRELRRTVFIVCGVGGRKSYELTYDAAPWVGRFGTFQIYDRSLRAVERVQELADALWGQSISVEWLLFLQGFNDLNAVGGPTSGPVWQQRVQSDIFAQYAADIPAITGQTTAPYFLFEMTPPGLNGEPNPVCLGQSSMATDNFNGRTYLACVSYGLPTNVRDTDQATTAHQTARGVTAQGELFGIAATDLLTGSTPRRCYIPQSAVSVASNKVTLIANRPLVVDTSSFPDPGNYGWQFRGTNGVINSGNSVTNVTVDGRLVLITLARPPSYGGYLEYAYERVGGQLSSGTAGVPWTDGETTMDGSAAQTPGAYGVLRAGDWTANSVYAPGFVLKLWLETGQWAL